MILLAIGILATFRLALLLHEEAGPFGICEKWREWLEKTPLRFNPGPDGDTLRMLGKLFDCYWCLSLWVALPVALAVWWGDWRLVAFYWLALSGGAILIYEFGMHGEDGTHGS